LGEEKTKSLSRKTDFINVRFKVQYENRNNQVHYLILQSYILIINEQNF